MISSTSILVFMVSITVVITAKSNDVRGNWRWECKAGYCQKVRIDAATREDAMSLPVCRLFCSKHAALWPQPTEIKMEKSLVTVNINSVDIMTVKSGTPVSDLIQGAGNRFKKNIDYQRRENRMMKDSRSLVVTFDLVDYNKRILTLDTDESYVLTVTEGVDKRIMAEIKANNFFGGRHGLETLSQLIIYDDLRQEIQMPNNVTVHDKPAYPHRGILQDTARSYISPAAIKRTLDGMASSKLNVFHWHITDTHSFPFVSKSRPILSDLGAYRPEKIYTPEQVQDIIQYARVRGVKVLAEFDAPAHVGEGWQDYKGYVTCFEAKPWQNYCVEPPCGQLDPTIPGIYDVLGDIYKDMVAAFDMDMFHMGGDEVSFACWNTTESIVTWMKTKKWGREEADFMKLWNVFQTTALDRFDKANGGKKVPIIMWTSHLTHPEYLHYLPNDRYIIQVWTTGNDNQVTNMLDKGYKLILSNYDALYLDCGFGGWVATGNNWCSPYIGWHKVYENRPSVIAGDKKHLILGGEATLWTEQSDDLTIDNRLWPRAAAWGERLWSDPLDTWIEADSRMLAQRERLSAMGINADLVQPEYCLQHEANCNVDDVLNVPDTV